MGKTSQSSQGSVLEIVAVAVVVAVIDSVGPIRPMRLIGLMSRRLRSQGMAWRIGRLLRNYPGNRHRSALAKAEGKSGLEPGLTGPGFGFIDQ
jgi:hypothetical protein